MNKDLSKSLILSCNKKIYSPWKVNGRKEIYFNWKHVKHNENYRNIIYLAGKEMTFKEDIFYFSGKEIHRVLFQKGNHTFHKVNCRKTKLD